jgi:FkbM family methyltransferase
MEDIIESPKRECERICKILKIAKPDGMEFGHKNIRNKFQKKRYGDSLDSSQIGVYKRAKDAYGGFFSSRPKELELIFRQLEPVALTLGYDISEEARISAFYVQEGKKESAEDSPVQVNGDSGAADTQVEELGNLQERNKKQVARSWAEFVKVIQDPDYLLDMGPGHPYTEAWLFSEAFPGNIIGLEANIQRYNYLKPIYPGELNNIAIAENCGVMDGYMGKPTYPDGCSDFKFIPEVEKAHFYDKVQIPTTTLDTLDLEKGPFRNAVLWADIEGSELRMLQGATKLLSEKRIQAILLEIWSFDEWYAEKEVIDYLAKFDYPLAKKVGNDHIFVRG